MRSRFRRVTAPILAAGALASYWIVAPFISDNRHQEYLRANEAAILTCAAVFFAFALRRAFRSDVKTSAQRFFLGLTLLLACSDLGAVWRLLWRMAGGGKEIAWMLTNDFVGFMLWGQIVGLMLMISGPAIPVYGPEGELEDERTSWRRLAVTGGVCALAVLVVVQWRPGAERLHEMLNVVEPYLRPVVFRVPDAPP